MATSAERMRTHRQRLQKGLRCLTIELRTSEIKELIRRGFVSETAATSPDAIRDALYAFLDRNLAPRI
jgi:hypothetical protein